MLLSYTMILHLSTVFFIFLILLTDIASGTLENKVSEGVCRHERLLIHRPLPAASSVRQTRRPVSPSIGIIGHGYFGWFYHSTSELLRKDSLVAENERITSKKTYHTHPHHPDRLIAGAGEITKRT